MYLNHPLIHLITAADGDNLPDETLRFSPALTCIEECGDVPSFIGTPIVSADQSYYLLNNHFKPGADYSFPNHTNGGFFQFLVNSRQVNGGFCLPYVLFLQVVTMGPIQVCLSAVI